MPKEIVETWRQIKNKLLDFFNGRKLIYRETNFNGEKIGKPRFDPPKARLPMKLDQELFNFLSKLKLYFQYCNYEFGILIKVLLDTKQSRESKLSPIFLIENDVWCTDNVYGDYLIVNENDISVFYYRRKQKRKEVSVNKKDLKGSIISNTKKQMVTQFNYIWNYLRNEIELAGEKKNFSSIFTTKNNLIKQFKLVEPIFEFNINLGLLYLGQSLEMMLKKIDKKSKNTVPVHKLIEKQFNEGNLTKAEYNTLNQIRKNYNKAKHDTNFEIDKELVINLKNKFKLILSDKLNR